ncbi:MAG: IS110 family transposase [Patescibacteria group bacterium]
MSRLVTESTAFLGLDIGKSEHAYAIVDSFGEVLARGKLKTDKRSLASFVSKTRKTHPDLVVGAEATGHYHESIAKTFLKAGVGIQVLNPQLTTTKALRSSVRSVKTDASDALGIAQKLREKRGKIGHAFSWDADRRALQALGRSYDHLLWQRQSLRAHVAVYAERGLPSEYAPRPTSLDPEIARLRGDLIREALRVFPTEFGIMTAIPGIGDETAARFLAETMGIERFRDGHALAAFAGLDPRVKESGTSIRGAGSMTKSGSPMLRFLLGWTAKNLVMWSEPFRRRFQYDLERGKPIGVAYGSIARRLTVVLHACLSKQVAFDPALVGTTAT